MFKYYKITPVPKPRMTRRDKWKKRPCVMRYLAFADECILKKVTVPESDYHVTFILPMPKSWSKRKKAEMAGTPHRPKPDKDNLEKALLDSIYKEDSVVWDGRTTKLWGYIGMIVIEY